MTSVELAIADGADPKAIRTGIGRSPMTLDRDYDHMFPEFRAAGDSRLHAIPVNRTLAVVTRFGDSRVVPGWLQRERCRSGAPCPKKSR